MNASEFVDTPSAPAETPAAPTGPEPSANELFAQAWSDVTPETTATPATQDTQDTPEPVQEEQTAQSDTPSPDSPPAPPELTQEYIDAQVQQRVAEAQRRAAEEAQRSQVEQALGKMSDAEYGAYMRQYQAQVAQFRSAQEAAMVNFYRESTTDVLTKIPELQKLSPDEAKKIDPRAASSYSELVSRMADVIAEKRAARVAESKAKELFEAWKTNEQAKLARRAQTIEEMSGRGADHAPDFDKTSGKAILEYAFSNQR